MRLIVDYPIHAAHEHYGDGNFVLAQLFKSNYTYMTNIMSARAHGRYLMLDNGAWEFGQSMEVKDYINIIVHLNPDVAVIPDTMKNMDATIDMGINFMTQWMYSRAYEKCTTKLMIAPQGTNITDLIYCYDSIMTKFYKQIPLVAIPKHVTGFMNRIQCVNEINRIAKVKTLLVHFLGFNGYDEFRAPGVVMEPVNIDGVNKIWCLQSIDSKYPYKQAVLQDHKREFKTQMEYYETNLLATSYSMEIAVRAWRDTLNMFMDEIGLPTWT